jgi:hypothetical protein
MLSEHNIYVNFTHRKTNLYNTPMLLNLVNYLQAAMFRVSNLEVLLKAINKMFLT